MAKKKSCCSTKSKKCCSKKSKVCVQPMEDRVLLKAVEAEVTTAGGILLPETAQEKPLQGTIISVGPGTLMDNGQRATLAVVPGDTVLYGKYAGTEIEVDGEQYLIMRENDILAIVE